MPGLLRCYTCRICCNPSNVTRTYIVLSADFSFAEERVLVSWHLSCTPGSIKLPTTDHEPQRVHGLWEHTCFEFFLGRPGYSDYIEYNQSPCGDWNSFRFSALREGMQETTAVSQRSFAFTRHSDGELVVTATVSHQLDWRQPLRLGLSAVLEHTDGLLYFALNHGHRPDFHNPDNHRVFP